MQLHQQKFIANTIISFEEINSNNRPHKLSHQHLYIKFWKVNVAGTLKQGIDYATLLTFPFPIVLFNFIEKDWN